MNTLRQFSALKFRFANLSDRDAILHLVESAYRGESSRIGWTTEADLLEGQRTDIDELRRLIEHPDDGGILLAEQNQQLIACAHLERHAEHIYFGMFSVSPAIQGGGVGKLMLLETERIVHEEWKLHRIEMSVIYQRIELIEWYERRGFNRTGETKPWPYGDLRFGLPKRNDLSFVVLSKSLI